MCVSLCLCVCLYVSVCLIVVVFFAFIGCLVRPAALPCGPGAVLPDAVTWPISEHRPARFVANLCVCMNRIDR